MSLQEAKRINTSLLALGNVINALTESRRGGGGTHVPFRDSVLTRILQQSIGGNCRTSLVICVSPADGDVTETLSTLRFASRAKRVQNHAHANVTIDATELSAQATALAETLQRQLEASEAQLEAAYAHSALDLRTPDGLWTPQLPLGCDCQIQIAFPLSLTWVSTRPHTAGATVASTARQRRCSSPSDSTSEAARQRPRPSRW